MNIVIYPPEEYDQPGLDYIKMRTDSSETSEQYATASLRQTTANRRHVLIQWRADGRSIEFEDLRDAAKFLRLSPKTLQVYLSGYKEISRVIYNSGMGCEGDATIKYIRNNKFPCPLCKRM